MTKRQNPFPGVTRSPDRHGKVRWRYRRKGRSGYLPGSYGSAEFRAAYEALEAGKNPDGSDAGRAPARGTFAWLIGEYRKEAFWTSLAPISRRGLHNLMERFKKEHGHRRIADLRRNHIEALMRRKAATPAAANNLLKLLRRLCLYAVERKLIATDPTHGIHWFKENPDGFHTWTDGEIAKYLEHHGPGTKPRLALMLMLRIGPARQDVSRMGWPNVRGNRIEYRRGKTGMDVSLPILPDLAEELRLASSEELMFFTHSGGRPYTVNSFGNWFRDQCVSAGLPHCSAHGIRKAGATQLADAGGTEFEVMVFLGHKTPQEARTYVKKANRNRLADSAMAKVLKAEQRGKVSNLAEWLDKLGS